MKRTLFPNGSRWSGAMAVLRFSLLSVILLFVATSCNLSNLLNQGDDDEDPIYPDEEKAAATATGSFTLNGKAYSDVASVGNMKYSGTMDRNSFKLGIINGEAPEVVMGTATNGNILFLYRGTLSSETPFEVNETTTAAALLSLLPSLWVLDPEEYPQFESKVKALNSFPKLVSAVRSAISKGQSVFDGTDETLVNATVNCYKELVAANSTSSSSSAVVTSAPNAADSNPLADTEDTRPIEFMPEANTVKVRTQGWGPVYECTVEHEGQTTSKLIYPHSAYGLVDLFAVLEAPLFNVNSGANLAGRYSEMWDNFTHGDWTEFDLNDVGDYQFLLDKNSTNAAEALKLASASDLVATITGKALGKYAKDNAALKEYEEQLEFLGDQLGAIASYVTNPENSTDREAFTSGLADLLTTIAQNFLLKDAEIGMDGSQLGEFFKQATEHADALSFFLNSWARVVMWSTAPDNISKCFSQHHMSISSCDGVGLCVKSGADQVGEPGKQLSLPVTFGVRCHVGQGIRLEVVSGGGSLDRYSKTVYQPDGSEEKVQINWTLGDTEGEQTIRAWIEDVDTHEKQGLAVTVSASASTGNLLASIGGYLNFQYDANNRVTKIVNRTCMLVEGSESEVVTYNVTYKDNSNNKIEKMTFRGDGGNTVLSNFKCNTDGLVESVSWTSTYDGETETGKTYMSYDKDGYLTRIVDNSFGDVSTAYFTWKDGNMVKFNSHQSSAGEDEDENWELVIGYGDKKNIHNQPTLSTMPLELLPFYFSNLFGKVPANLPTSLSSDGSTMMCDYVLRSDGYIGRETAWPKGNSQYAWNFNYSYIKDSGAAKVAPSGNTTPQASMKALKSLKSMRLFGRRK